jgi:hypothetical protein
LSGGPRRRGPRTCRIAGGVVDRGAATAPARPLRAAVARPPSGGRRHDRLDGLVHPTVLALAGVVFDLLRASPRLRRRVGRFHE